MNFKALLCTAFALTLPVAGANATTFTTNATINPGLSPYENQDIVVSNCTLTVNGAHSFASLTLTNNAVLTHAAAPAGETNNRLDLIIAGDVMIEASSMISVQGKGYGGNAGPGTSQYDGASYGGGGGAGGGGVWNVHGARGPAYGSMTQPLDFGSGGGNATGPNAGGSSGGGLIRLSVGGRLVVNGAINANGDVGILGAGAGSYGSGGSGGSIYLTVGELSGSGSISANGGQGLYSFWDDSTSGGGGGGRIAAYFQANTLTGSVQAVGGNGYMAGGAGTVYLKAASQALGDLLVDNGGTNGAMTLLTSPVAYNVVIANGAVVYSSEPLLFNNLDVAAGGTVTHLQTNLGVQITCLGNLTIESTGVITAQGKGYSGSTGPGTAVWGGGGYGGRGGAMETEAAEGGGPTYGSMTEPLDFGSGGGHNTDNNTGGGNGGGLIRLTVGGILLVNGVINANGSLGGHGLCTSGSGGSGGSVYLTIGELSGSGSIMANGARGLYSGCSGLTSGGGGGGRIAAYFQANTLTGSVQAVGGNGYVAGGAGTVYLKAASQAVGDLLVDNGGTNGAMTLLTSPVACNVVIANGAVVYSSEPLVFNNLDVAAGGTVTHLQTNLGVQITCLGSLTIESNGVITAQGKGYSGGTGPGTALYGGGGYGGRGGAMQGYLAEGGGPTYGSTTELLDFGSGGGLNIGANAGGGNGGGLIRLTVGGILNVNGVINANGSPGGKGECTSGSGGSGGSVYLTIGELSGSGTISANGGQGWWTYCSELTSGGGGGGRMAIYGTISSGQAPLRSVSGGSGWQDGESGSYYTSANIPPMVLFSTQFEATEGYSTATDLVGQNGWLGLGSGGNGVVTNYFVGQGQQAFIGFFPPDQGADGLTVWRPINLSPIPTNMPVVEFSVLMSIVNPYNTNYDDFEWSVYNVQGDFLFHLGFDNYYHGIYYALDGTNYYVWTGRTFANDDTNTLVITMNFIQNYWSATFGGVLLAKNKRITTTGAPLNLGNVRAEWVFDPAHPGDDYMVFDNYQITAEVLPSVSPPATTNTFFTQFEATEGYRTATDLVGQNGWLGLGSGGNGVVTNYFVGQGQQAFIGAFPADQGDDYLSVWRPINFSPIAANLPVVEFSVLMSIVDSSNTNYDDFDWGVYNAQGDRLFTLAFNNDNCGIYYLLDGTNNWVRTGNTFTNDDINTLVITMNFVQNSWSATFGGLLLAKNEPITTTGAPLNLGDVDAVWVVRDPAHPGNNYMVFDNYRITSEALPLVPPSLSIAAGGGPQVQVTWTTNSVGYLLEQSASLTARAWEVVTNVPAITSDHFVLMMDAGGSPRFFRLRK